MSWESSERGLQDVFSTYTPRSVNFERKEGADMEESLVTQVSRYLKSQRRRKIGYQVLTCMASVVVFCTVYALILPAITISNEMTCGLAHH